MRTRSRLSAPRVTRQELALIGITALWGSTFLVVHLAVQHGGPLFFVGVRFLAAGVIAAAVFARALRRLTWREVAAGAAIGAAIFGGYGLQTYGLQTISSSTSAFLTALYVPLVPLLEWAVFRRPPKLVTWIGVALAFGGLLLLAAPGAAGISLGPGEIVTIVSILPIAAEVILISVFARTMDMRRLTVVQLLVAGALSFLGAGVTGEAAPAFSWAWLAPALLLGAASALIQLTMNWAQKSVSPSRATVIYAGEPVWGGIVGRMAGDRLPLPAIVGALLIVAGTLVSEWKPKPRSRDLAVGEDDSTQGAEELEADPQLSSVQVSAS
jgi:drug/metabolite transporter (DMT)-like permease